MTAVDRLAWELRIREGVPLKLCGTIPSGTTVFGIEGTNAELRAALYSALALLGDDGSQGRPPANADELMALVDPAKVFVPGQGVGGGGGERRVLCEYCSSGIAASHTAACARPR